MVNLNLTLEDIFADAHSKRRDPNLNDEVLASEVVVVLLLGISLAGVLTLLTSWFGSTLIRTLILS